jgi:tellurite resistance protein TerC
LNPKVQLFPFDEYWWFYAAFTLLVMVLLLVDLGVFHRKAHVIGFKEALRSTFAWMSLAGIFNFAFYRFALWKFEHDPRLLAVPGFNATLAAKNAALEFLSGYVVEQTLSVDNMFVFVLVFAYFRVPTAYQHRVLFYGILGAILFRSIFIALGSLLLGYTWVIWLFGGFLVFTGIKMLFAKEDDQPDLEHNTLLQWLRRFMPVTSQLYGPKFFIEDQGKRVATPLFLTLVLLEASDVVFAVDSVPAIFALTREPLIVFTSNIFAILGLRSMYFMLAGAVHRFHLLRYGLAIILIFIGLKMAWLNEAFSGHFPTSVSLGIIGGVLTVSIVLSLLFPKKDPVSSGA